MADIKSFAVNPTQKLLDQIEALGNCVAYKDSTIRVMADGHPGKGAVVGSVITYTDKIVPATVGVDISCSVSLFPLPFNVDLPMFDRAVHAAVPTGTNVHAREMKESQDFPYEELHCWSHFTSEQQSRIRLSMGTMGSGNHFCSIDRDEGGKEYMVVHCGTRSLGKLCCEYYQGLAEKHLEEVREGVHDSYLDKIRGLRDSGRTDRIQDVVNEMTSEVEKYENKEFAYLEGELMLRYLQDMDMLRTWAYLNHRCIARNVAEVYFRLSRRELDFPKHHMCQHNYVDLVSKVIRKGAISAKAGELGIIPLNMGDGVLVVRGIGDADTLCSLPHGAGRQMSRSEARKSITLDEYRDAMKGVYSTTVREGSIDEAPMAYKPADSIIEAIDGHCKIVAHLCEIYNYKDC